MDDQPYGRYEAEAKDKGPRLGYEIGDHFYWLSYHPSVDWCEWGSHFLPQRFSVLVEGKPLPYTVEFDIEVDDGKPVARSMTLHRLVRWHQIIRTPRMPQAKVRTSVGVNDLSSADLRRVPVDRLFRRAVLVALHSTPSTGGRQAEAPPFDEWEEAFMEGLELPQERRRKLDDAHYREVAEVYRSAWTGGRHPKSAVALRFQVSDSTAGRYVVEARKRGFLGPTDPGQPGEKAKPKKGRSKRKATRKKGRKR